MNRFTFVVALLIQTLAMSSAFVTRPTSFVSQTRLYADEDDSNVATIASAVERGVSIDQDGKSNVWAIEPKMEVSTKSKEEQTSSALIAGGGLAVFAVFAGLALTNLPDPNQF